MNPSRICLSLVALLAVAACAERTDRRETLAEMEDTRANERRACLVQPPGQVEMCLRRVEEDFVARQGMRRLQRTGGETEAEPAPAPPAAQ